MILAGVLKITFRNFRKNRTTDLIKILGLSVSLSASIIIWSFVINENKYDKGVSTRDRIFRLETNWASMPSFLGHAFNQNISGQIVSTRLNFWEDVGIQIDNNPFNLKELTFADSTFFKTFPLEFVAGNRAESLIKPFSLVITESLAKRLFGSNDPVGKTVRFEDQFDFTVTAIIKDQPYLHFSVTALASIISLEQIRYKDILKQYDGWSYPTYLLSPKNLSTAEFDKTVKDFLKKTGYGEQFRLRPFNDIYYSPEVENESNTKHGNILYNRILLAVSIFILLLAAINFINLTIANSVSRIREVSLKKLQGALRLQLLLQFLFETLFYVLVSAVFAFLLIWFINPILDAMTGFSVNGTDFCSMSHLLILISGLAVFISISGIYPGLLMSKFNINTGRGIVSGNSNHIGIRNGLIIFQNFISITLICCTLIARQQFSFMNKADLGFDKKNILILKLNSQLKKHPDLFKEKLLSYPEIANLSFSSRIPGNYWGSWCCVKIEGNENKYFNNYIDPDYLKTMSIKIKEGRNFSYKSPADEKTTYLINETAIKMYGLKDPVGQLITPGNGESGEIIGIVQDFHYRGLNYSQTPVLLFNTSDYKNYVNIRINNNNIPAAIGKIKTVWAELCPAFAFEYTFLDETYDLQYKSEKRFEGLLFIFTILAILIASIGLLGLSIYSTERRTKEIGLRRVNGAGIAEIIIMLDINFIKWIAISFVLACPVAWIAMSKWLQTFTYRTELKVWFFGFAGLIALVVALATVSWQSWRSATRNPVEALRYE